MSKLKIAIIMSTTRAARFGQQPQSGSATLPLSVTIIQGADFMAVWKDGKIVRLIPGLAGFGKIVSLTRSRPVAAQ